MLRYEDYKGREPEQPDLPQPYFPSYIPSFSIRKTGDRRKMLGVWWPIYHIILSWGTPLRARYVHRYEMSFLSTYSGWARRRKLCVLDWRPFSFGGKIKGIRYQSQEKFLPVDGTWKEDWT